MNNSHDLGAGSDRRLLAACGLYCGACFHYRASRPDGMHLLTDAARGGRPLAGFTCHGCRSDRLYVHLNCRACQIRDCADRRGVPHCGLCDAAPCELLLAFQHDGRPHHRDVVANLREAAAVGVDVWLARQADRWRCPSCDAPFSWYEAACHVCGSALPSYGATPPPRDGATSS